jgi:hypothetical protein
MHTTQCDVTATSDICEMLDLFIVAAVLTARLHQYVATAMDARIQNCRRHVAYACGMLYKSTF